MYVVFLFAVFLSHASAKPTNTNSNYECVTLPPMCNKLMSSNYRELRLPNMLNHTRYEDVYNDLNFWSPLLNSSKCNANNQLRYFLCFTYAPVCVDKLISPCKSLCETVRDSCDPVMRRYNYSWPGFFNCNDRSKFHLDSSPLCIHMKMLGIKRQLCSCTGNYNRQALKTLICNSDFVLSGWVTKQGRHGHIEVKASRVFNQKYARPNLLTAKSIKLRVFSNKRPCRCNRLRVKKKPRGSGRYLIIGSVVGGRMTVDGMKKMKDPHGVARMVKQC